MCTGLNGQLNKTIHSSKNLLYMYVSAWDCVFLTGHVTDVKADKVQLHLYMFVLSKFEEVELQIIGENV